MTDLSLVPVPSTTAWRHTQVFTQSSHQVFAALVQAISVIGFIVSIEDFGSAVIFHPTHAAGRRRPMIARVEPVDEGSELTVQHVQGDAARLAVAEDVVRTQNLCDALAAHLTAFGGMRRTRERPEPTRS